MGTNRELVTIMETISSNGVNVPTNTGIYNVPEHFYLILKRVVLVLK